MAEAILNLPRFQDADKAREYLEALRWPSGVICPHCGVIDGHYKLQGKATRPGVYKCGSCSDQFTVTVGTVFERSKIALNIWLQAVHLMCASKKGVSAKQVERMLGVSYKTAWFMCHRIREAMTTNTFTKMGGPGTIVEADETYWGNNNAAKLKGGSGEKMKIVSLVERETGQKRSFHVANVTVTQLEAAHKQLKTAIVLWLNDDDPVSIHTLAFAAHQIVHDLNRQQKGPPLLLDSPLIRPEKKQEFVNIVKGDANYFKHADDRGKKRKAPPSIDFEPSINEHLFGFTIHGLKGMGEQLTPHEIAFDAWYGINRPELLTDAGLQLLQNSIHADTIRWARSLPKKHFFERLIGVMGNS